MKITNIVKQRKEGRYNIYIDGSFAFGLFKETIYKFGLRVNDSFDKRQIAEILEYDEYLKAQRLAYKYLSYKSRTSKELFQRLKKSQINTLIINKIIKLFTKQGLINDDDYINTFIETRKFIKPLGARAIKNKLCEKGIDPETIEQKVREKYTQEEEEAIAKQVLLKYLKTLKEKDERKRQQKSFRYLISKGFSFEITMKLLRNSFKSLEESDME